MENNLNLPKNNQDLEDIYWRQHLNKAIRDANLHRMLVTPNYPGEWATVLMSNTQVALIVTEDKEKIIMEGYPTSENFKI